VSLLRRRIARGCGVLYSIGVTIQPESVAVKNTTRYYRAVVIAASTAC